MQTRRTRGRTMARAGGGGGAQPNPAERCRRAPATRREARPGQPPRGGESEGERERRVDGAATEEQRNRPGRRGDEGRRTRQVQRTAPPPSGDPDPRACMKHGPHPRGRRAADAETGGRAASSRTRAGHAMRTGGPSPPGRTTWSRHQRIGPPPAPPDYAAGDGPVGTTAGGSRAATDGERSAPTSTEPERRDRAMAPQGRAARQEPDPGEDQNAQSEAGPTSSTPVVAWRTAPRLVRGHAQPPAPDGRPPQTPGQRGREQTGASERREGRGRRRTGRRHGPAPRAGDKTTGPTRTRQNLVPRVK